VRLKGPLADSYPAAVLLVVFALIPYLALTTALTPLMPVISKSVGLSQQSFQLTSGMANAAYAFGTVLAVQFQVHLRGRRMLFLYASLFVVGSIMAAAAWTPGFFIAGHIVQGLCTSLMLIAAVPPLVIGWPASKMPWTGGIMNMCIFGAVALGPVIGGVQAGAKDWRPLFWIVAGVGVLAVSMVVLTFQDQEPQDKSAPWDWVAQTLAGLGCGAAFFGASELSTHPFTSLVVFLPLLAGLAMIVALVVYEATIREPLMPIRSFASTFPFAGVLIAMTAGAASVAIVELVQNALQSKIAPTHLGVLFLPEFGAAVGTAILFGFLFRTRLVALLAFSGLLFLSAGAAVLTHVTSGADAIVLAGSALVGLGVGASVSPALFLAGFSLQSDQLPRVFALVELLRGVAAFMFAPIVLHIAQTVARTPAQGTKIGIWICFGVAAAGAVAALCTFLLGRARLQVPDLEPWLEGDAPAIDSPPLLAAVRDKRAELAGR
jgi:MFS family permease